MRTIRGARKAPMPGFVPPQLATLKTKPPGGDHLHEVKFDGYRVQPHISRGHTTLYTRNGLNWTKRFRPIADALDQNISAILDGEVVVVADDRPNFSLLQADLASGRKDRMALYVFDILYLDGQDLRDVPLIGRKQVLASLRSKFRSPIFLSEHFDVDGPDLFESVSRMGLEGIISKRKDAPYKSGRTETWIKVKCVRTGRFPIVGFIPDVGGVSALYLGKREGKDLIYAGKVGSGFSQKTSMSVRRALEPLVTKESRLTRKVRKPKAKWVEPRFFADVEYRDITAEGLLRQSAFKGMNEI
jgi:bifunctional non-homologous end joining protein LigD